MSSGSRGGRVSDKSGNAKIVTDHNSHNNNAVADKNLKAPTADQIRLAQITENTQDNILHENIEQFMQITRKSREDASIILHDYGYDLEAAVNATLEGNTNLDTWHERTKKKKTKSKVEVENKENRRGGNSNASDNNKERSVSRGRGGGTAGNRGQSSRGRRDGEGGGRGGGPGSRRGGRMANGGGPVGGGGRGRGGRSIRGGRGGGSARGSSPHFSDSTFHINRQNNHSSGFDDPIDTWGDLPVSGKMEGFNDLGTSDPSPLEEWGDEWTGSLDKTNVFTHSSVEPTPPPASDLTAIDAAKLVNSSSMMQSPYQDESVGLMNTPHGDAPQSYSAAATPSVLPPNLSGLVANQGQQSLSSSGIGGLAALLQQAAPQSQLTTGGSSAVTNGSVTHLQQHSAPNILGGISTNMGDVIKASGTQMIGGPSVQQPSLGGSALSYSANNSTGSSSYAAAGNIAASISNNYSSSQHNSIFSTSLQNSVSRNLGTSLSSSNAMNASSNAVSSSVGGANKPGVILPSHQGVTLPPPAGHHAQPRAKQNKVKPQQTSKIPLSAVEMPEDVMSAINIQMTGLQFGSEGFDFLSDSNKSSSALANESTSSYSGNAYSNPPPSGYPSSLVSASGVSTSSYGKSNSAVPVATTPSAAGSASSYSSYHGSNAYPSASNSVSSYQNQSTYSSNSLSSTVAGLAADRAEVQKSLSSVKQSTLSQASKLGPEPIPYPNQLQSSATNSSTSGNGTPPNTANHSDLTKSQQIQGSSSADASSSSASYLSMRSSTATTPQKKDLSGGAGAGANTSSNLSASSGAGISNSSNPLGSLVGAGSVSSHYSSYSLPQTSTTFPSPTTGPYSQPHVQNSYSNSGNDAGNSYSNSSSNSASGASASNSSNNNATSVSSVSSNTNNSASNYGGSSSYGSSSQTAVAAQSSAASVQYQNNNYNSSSHSSLGMNASALGETNQVNYNGSDPSNSGTGASISTSNSSTAINNSSNTSASLSNLQQAAAAVHQQLPQQQQKTSVANVPPPGASGSKAMGGVGMPPGVQQQQYSQQQHITQQHQVAAVAQQQLLMQQPQQQQQFVSSNALQNTMPYFQSLPQQIYSFDEMQLLQHQQRIAHMQSQQGVPSTLPGSRDVNSLTAAAAVYSASADSKYRTDQNSSPVPSAINTQGGHGGPYIANAGNAAAAGMPQMYMYPQNMAAVPSSAFAQYGHQAIIQLPPSTVGSTSSQFQHAAKLQYNAPPSAAGGPTYYDSQVGGDYKGGYGSGSQGQNKQGVGSNSASMSNSVNDMPTYKNHLTKSYDKPAAFHTSTPPPFNLASSGGAPYPHPQVFLPTMPHQSTLMHHQLHQDGSGSGGQRGSSGSVQNKNVSKAAYQPFWSS